MKVKRKLIFVLLAIVLIMGLCINTVSATITQDGLEVEIITDKEEYKSDEPINVTVKLTNTNDFDVTNIKIESKIPDGLILSEGQAIIERETLATGETIQLNCVLIKDDGITPTPTPTGTLTPESTNPPTLIPPKTGDTSLMGVCIGGLCIAVAGLLFAVIYRHKNKLSKIISVILCLAIALPSVLGLVMLRPEAEEDITDNSAKTKLSNATLETTKDIVVGDVSFEYLVLTYYMVEEDNPLYISDDMYISSHDNAAIQRKDGGLAYISNEISIMANFNVSKEDIELLVKKYDGSIIGYIGITNDFQIRLKHKLSYNDLITIIDELNESELVNRASITYVYPNLTPNYTVEDTSNS